MENFLILKLLLGKYFEFCVEYTDTPMDLNAPVLLRLRVESEAAAASQLHQSRPQSGRQLEVGGGHGEAAVGIGLVEGEAGGAGGGRGLGLSDDEALVVGHQAGDGAALGGGLAGIFLLVSPD